MARAASEATTWAGNEFGDASLGDARRTRRLVQLAARACENPGGKVSDVVRSARELDAAYDLLESKHCSPRAIGEAIAGATARRCAGLPYVRVAIDGSSLQLTDFQGDKGFGSIGPLKAGARGLKVISALAVSPDGVTLGLLAQTWWARTYAYSADPNTKRKRRIQRSTETKETGRWLEAIDLVCEQLDVVGARAWFQIDREGDAWPILTRLDASEHLFTVRSSWDRVLVAAGRDRQYLRGFMAKQRPIGTYKLEVAQKTRRKARTARMVMRCAEVTLRLRDQRTSEIRALTLRAVWVRERGTTPKGERPLDWLLLTNARVGSVAGAQEIVAGYAARWRVEEFHRTWKSGTCDVEQTQLRSRDAVVRWATILAAVATRVERLKLLARSSPEKPATDELTSNEIRVLLALKHEERKCNEELPDGVPTIAQATRWLADLGGYTGKSSGGPPGSTTIRRGLERVVSGVRVLRALSNWDK